MDGPVAQHARQPAGQAQAAAREGREEAAHAAGARRAWHRLRAAGLRHCRRHQAAAHRHGRRCQRRRQHRRCTHQRDRRPGRAVRRRRQAGFGPGLRRRHLRQGQAAVSGCPGQHQGCRRRLEGGDAHGAAHGAGPLRRRHCGQDEGLRRALHHRRARWPGGDGAYFKAGR